MGGNGMFTLGFHQFYQAAGTGMKQHLSGKGATRRHAWAHESHQNNAGSHDERDQKPGTENIVLFITHAFLLAQRGNACIPRHVQPPAHLNEQRVSIKPGTKQAAHASVTQEQLKVWL